MLDFSAEITFIFYPPVDLELKPLVFARYYSIYGTGHQLSCQESFIIYYIYVRRETSWCCVHAWSMRFSMFLYPLTRSCLHVSL